MAINNILFPPVIDTYAPAFLIGSSSIVKNTCKLYFSLSNYNSINEIRNVQVSIANQKTNESVLNKTKYPCEIMLTPIYTDTTRVSDDKYYIEIVSGDIEDGFEINQYYKVQLRFTGADATSVSLDTPQAIDSWLANPANLSNFSEWSTVCLIRGISTPSINIVGFDNIADVTFLSISNVDIVGKLTFANAAEKDTLKQYQIKLYNELDELLTDSGIIYTNNYSNPNEINYTIKYSLNESDTYYFTLDYETNNMYSDSVFYKFTVVQDYADKIAARMTAIEDVNNGRLGIHLEALDGSGIFTGNITIRRCSSETNFTIWEDVHTATFDGTTPLNYTWWDMTIKSGVYYKYLAQRRTSVGQRGIALHLEKEPFMLLFDDMFLTGGNEQLNIRFDPSVSSFKRVVSEAKIDTIGSKDPHVTRNANTGYRQFPIGGTITHLMDNANLITSCEEVFKDSLQNYKEFNEEHRINDFNDWTYEREFREKVMDFLYENKVRLFRSATEGNILVKLTDINFTPNATLGRRIYSFTATANEIDECSIENYDKYGIQGIGEYSQLLQMKDNYVGQYNEIIPAKTEVLELIKEKYEKYAKEGFKINLENLDFLRIEMETPPYLIKEGADGPYAIDDTGSDREDSTSAILGYLVYINDEPIVINPEGIYELKGSNVLITSLVFEKECKTNISYHVNINQTEDSSKVMKTSSFFKRAGQLWGAFEPDKSIYQMIWNKYYENYTDYIQSMLSLDGVRIEAEPGTVIYVKETADTDFQRHVIGETHTLELNSKDTAIEGLYFIGVHLEEANEYEQQRDIIPHNKYIETGITLDKVVEPGTEYLIKNGVYTLADDYLEILNNWYGDYSFRSKQQWLQNDTVSINKNNIKQENSDYVLKLDRVLEAISEDGGITIAENWIEHINNSDYWTGEYILDATQNDIVNTQADINNEEDIIPTGESKEIKGYVFKSKEQWDNEDTASINNHNIRHQNGMYTMKLNKGYDHFYTLTLTKEINKEFALILQRWIDESNSRFIWYNDQWWLFTNNDDLLCPVEAIVDYYCEIMKGRYNI